MKKILLLILFSVSIVLRPCLAETKAFDKRYISLAPSTTEILFKLGLGKQIIGVSSYCDYPPEAAAKEKIGTFSSPNIEKIIAMNPDYIFCTGLEQDPAITQLIGLKMNVYNADPSSIRELLNSILEIGKITGRETEAEALVEDIKYDMREVSENVKLIPPEKRKKVFLEIWHEPLMTAGIGSFIDEMIQAAGGTNIADNTRRSYTIFSAEEVVKKNPDCIILAYMDRQNALTFVSRRHGWNGLSAVKNRQVFNDIDPNIILRPGPRLGIAIKEMNKRFYP